MAWSNTNTVTYTTAADNHTALVYLFDTYLAARGWTVAAHPGSLAYKRKLKYTATNYATNANNTMYHWVDWLNTSGPTSMNWYEDATFTTVPGDLCTSTTNSISVPWTDATSSTKNWRFWTSSVVANACLVTRGKHVMLYWPGMSKFYVEEASSWTAGNQNNSTFYFPLLSSTNSYWPAVNAPMSLGSSATNFSVVPLISASSTRVMGAKTYKNFTMGYGGDTNSSVQVNDYGFAWHETNSDVALYVPAANRTNRNMKGTSTTPGALWLSGSDYYLNANADSNQYGLLFYMGTSEPTLT